jgi:hypothetical protein
MAWAPLAREGRRGGSPAVFAWRILLGERGSRGRAASPKTPAQRSRHTRRDHSWSPRTPLARQAVPRRRGRAALGSEGDFAGMRAHDRRASTAAPAVT